MVHKVPDEIGIYYGDCRPGRRCAAREPVKNKVTRDEVIELLEESIDKIEKWDLYGDQWISNYVNEVKEVINGFEKYEELNEYHKLIINPIREILKSLLNRVDNDLRNYWVSTLGNEVAELIQDIISGKAQVIINKTSKTLTVHIYKTHITLDVNKIRNNSGTTTQLRIKGLRGGINIEIPNIFKEIMNKGEYEKLEKEILVPLRLGFAKTDEIIRNRKPAMITAHLWQAILWMLLYPGKIHISINGIDINKNDVKIKWYLETYGYNSLKNEAFDVIKNSDKTVFFNFVHTAILGDADVSFLKHDNRIEPIIRLSIGYSEYEKWETVLNVLRDFGINFRTGDYAKGETQVRIRGSNAVKLARNIIEATPPIIRVLFDNLSIDKWNKLKQMACMELGRRRGRSQVEIGNIGFSISINDRGYVTLRLKSRREGIINEARNILKSLGLREDFDYGAKMSNDYNKIIIYHEAIFKNEWLKKPVIEKLYEMMNRANNNEKRKRKILKALQRLIQTQSSTEKQENHQKT